MRHRQRYKGRLYRNGTVSTMGRKIERWYCLGEVPGSTSFFVSRVEKLDTVRVSVLVPALQEKIYKSMKNAARYDRVTHHFFRLCYFLEKDKPAPLQEPDSRLKGIQQALRTLTFSLADDCSIGLLEKTLELLTEKYTMVNGIIVYRKEKQKDS